MKTNRSNSFCKCLFCITFLLTLTSPFVAQINITLKYKKAKCGGARPQDTTSYFLLSNKKWILISPHNKIDTVYTDGNGILKIPNKKGRYKLFEPWKYYQSTPFGFPIQLYNRQCLQKYYQTPDFTIKVHSSKKYNLTPAYYSSICPDKHPCLRTDTIIPRIPIH